MKRLALLLLFAGCSGEPADTVAAVSSEGWVAIGGFCHRLEVPGGWLVRHKSGYAGGLTYVPDAAKEWRR